jgi:hypothetical protein
MCLRYELKLGEHYKPNRLNLSLTRDYLDFRAVLNIDVYRWLVQHHFPHSITITHCETSDPDRTRWTTYWLAAWERRIQCFIEFDDPSHLLLFKLTWG